MSTFVNIKTWVVKTRVFQRVKIVRWTILTRFLRPSAAHSKSHNVGFFARLKDAMRNFRHTCCRKFHIGLSSLTLSANSTRFFDSLKNVGLNDPRF